MTLVARTLAFSASRNRTGGSARRDSSVPDQGPAAVAVPRLQLGPVGSIFAQPGGGHESRLIAQPVAGSIAVAGCG